MHRNKKIDAEPVLLVDPKWNDLKAKLLIEKHNHEVKSSCYRDTTIEALRIIYAEKCAICERKRGLEFFIFGASAAASPCGATVTPVGRRTAD